MKPMIRLIYNRMIRMQFNKLIAAIGLLFIANTGFSQQAELSLQKEYLVPLMRLEPFPSSGIVDRNAPWFYWSPMVKSKSGVNTYKWDDAYLYQGRVSKNKDFTGASTITSDLREWAFFNPHKALSKGTWYWQYATVNRESGEKKWSEPISFEITGDERVFVIPRFEKVLQRIPKSHPRIFCEKEDIGNMKFPASEVTSFISKVDGELGKDLPKTLIYSNKEDLAKRKAALSESNFRLFVAKRTKEIYRSEKQDFEQFIKAYLITGDQKYMDESLRRYDYLKDRYNKIIEADYWNDFTEGFYVTISTLVYDVCYDRLSENVRMEIQSFLKEYLEDSYHHILHKGEHFSIDNHLWQHHFRSFFVSALALAHHVPETENWMKYVYEVWSMRAPVGSLNDGSWVPGNGYFDANKESLITMPVILSRFTGVNYFDQPWYHNVAAYMAYTSPVGHVSGCYGDNADIKRENNMDFVRAMTTINGDRHGMMYSNLGEILGHPQNVRGIREPKDEECKLPMSLYEDGNIYWYMYQPEIADLAKVKAIKSPKRARCFRDVGIVAMHTNLLKPEKNLMLSFRSSPFGLYGHSHACQNSFNIQYGGKPLFFRTGYYSSFIDPHSVHSYRHTRAHNSILADGMGQTFTTSGYGWIARFMNGDQLSYTLGDASAAYSGLIFRDLYPKRFKKWDMVANEDNGFGEPGVSKFRRHISMLGEDIIVIYDELEANKPVDWSWLIHSKDTLALNDNVYYTENGKGKGKLWLYSGDKINLDVTDQFFSPAEDWLGNGKKRGIEFVNHWHGESKTETVGKTRFLAIIQVKPNGETFNVPVKKNDGVFEINGWKIEAELKADRKAALRMVKAGVGAIDFGSLAFEFEGKTYKHKIAGSSMLLEVKNGKVEMQEVVDELPHVAKYY
ncbi:DUF4962 domain-containing protein [Puteibacter caeruleilacunae]|nr:DUF4962 domain-containing protein [Puteibacter caeruleilacunae]